MDISVVAAAREDESPPTEALIIAAHAEQLGFGEIWFGEGPTWDAFVLATAVGIRTEHAALTVGPLPVSVRDPETIGRAAASAAAVTGRPVNVALGTSSKRVVEDVHGRSRAGVTDALAESAEAVRELLGDDRSPHPGGFTRRLPPAHGSLTVAAFGDRAIEVAVNHADRMLLDLVSPEQVRTLREKRDAAAERAGRTPPRLVAWLPAAIDPAPPAVTQVQRSIVGYLTVRGYSDMFSAAGFDRAVQLAAGGAGKEELLSALPVDAAAKVGLVGDPDTVESRLAAYADAGLDELAVYPATAGDPAGERTLTALARMRAEAAR